MNFNKRQDRVIEEDGLCGSEQAWQPFFLDVRKPFFKKTLLNKMSLARVSR